MPRYRTTLRPVGFGGLPAGVGWRYVELPTDFAGPAPALDIPYSRHLYGVVETDRELTPAELEHFSIEPA